MLPNGGVTRDGEWTRLHERAHQIDWVSIPCFLLTFFSMTTACSSSIGTTATLPPSSPPHVPSGTDEPRRISTSSLSDHGESRQNARLGSAVDRTRPGGLRHTVIATGTTHQNHSESGSVRGADRQPPQPANKTEYTHGSVVPTPTASSEGKDESVSLDN
jgi:hypothetical protein